MGSAGPEERRRQLVDLDERVAQFGLEKKNWVVAYGESSKVINHHLENRNCGAVGNAIEHKETHSHRTQHGDK